MMKPEKIAREPAPRINEADGLGADAGRIKLGLIGVERERHPVVAQRDQETAGDHAGCGGLLREQKAERGDADGGPGDLPFALETVGERTTPTSGPTGAAIAMMKV